MIREKEIEKKQESIKIYIFHTKKQERLYISDTNSLLKYKRHQFRCNTFAFRQLNKCTFWLKYFKEITAPKDAIYLYIVPHHQVWGMFLFYSVILKDHTDW